MLKRHRRVRSPLTDAVLSFREVVAALEHAKEELVAAVPTGRIPGIPLAVALASFESGLEAAGARMPGWRTAEWEDEWRACVEGLEEAARRAERLRLHGTPQSYEELLGSIGHLLEPLDRFAAAGERLLHSAP